MRMIKKLLINVLWAIPILIQTKDEHITQMIYADKQYNPYVNEKKIFNNIVIYYLSGNQLYIEDITDPSNRSDVKIDIYQLKDKAKQKKWEANDSSLDLSTQSEKDFESIDNHDIMRIGQPAIVPIKGKKQWAMPLVKKDRWFSGNFLWGRGNIFRTDVCILQQQEVLKSQSSDEDPSNNRKTIYLLKKVGEGHRDVTNFVGFYNVVPENMNIPSGCAKLPSGWAILSSSDWPTTKWRFLDTRQGIEWKNLPYYVVDSQSGKENFFILAQRIQSNDKYGIKTLLLNTAKSESLEYHVSDVSETTIYNESKTKSKKYIDSDIPLSHTNLFAWISYLPSIKIDPAFFTTSTNINSIEPEIKRILQIIADDPSPNKFNQLQVYLRPNQRSIIIPEHMAYEAIRHFNEGIDFEEEIEGEVKDIYITASTCNFEHDKLMLGLYNKRTGKKSIKIIPIAK